jgi:hypothetical protein
MPPKKKKTSRKRDRAVSLTGVAEAIMLANVGTQMAFSMNAWDWISDGWTSTTAGRAGGAGQISLHELIYGNFSTAGSLGVTLPSGYQAGGSSYAMTQSSGDVVWQNIQSNWMPALVKSIAIPAGFKIGRRALSRPIRMGNKLLKQIGLRGQVKI